MMELTRIRGFSDDIGSWKIICRSRRTRRSSLPESLRDVCPSNSIRPAVGSRSRTTQRAEGRLAAARLAHQPERLALLELEADVVDGLEAGDLLLEHDALGHREVLAQVLDGGAITSPSARHTFTFPNS